uniref:Uncharacterized protein n=1 Tax=Trieres chinensis TaxID=1514140 RepID=A0A7S2EJJ7_TRICV
MVATHCVLIGSLLLAMVSRNVFALALVAVATLSRPPLAVHAWSFSKQPTTPSKKDTSSQKGKVRSAAIAATLAVQISTGVIGQPAFAVGDDGVDWSSVSRIPSTSVKTMSDTASASEEEMRRLGLRPPTEEKPQITMAGSGRGSNIIPQRGISALSLNQKNERSPIAVGLVYLANEQNRPSYSDTLVITAATDSEPGTPLAGAKFSIAKAKFPFQFSMYDDNILQDVPGGRPQGWYRATIDQDIIITARVCPEDSPKLPCAENESIFNARGICKLIRGLPGMKEGQVVRTPASLALE